MTFIWATRGHTWGFRFLRDGGLQDPLPAYDKAFSGASDDDEVFHRQGDTVALRFLDPDGKRDASGRVIPHEFVITGPEARVTTSVEDGRRLLWPLVVEEFARAWGLPTPPRN